MAVSFNVFLQVNLQWDGGEVHANDASVYPLACGGWAALACKCMLRLCFIGGWARRKLYCKWYPTCIGAGGGAKPIASLFAKIH